MTKKTKYCRDCDLFHLDNGCKYSGTCYGFSNRRLQHKDFDATFCQKYIKREEKKNGK